MAVVTKVFDILTRKLQKLQFDQEIDENSSSSLYDYILNETESKDIRPIEVPQSQMMELELLDKKIRRLNLKLKKHNIFLHIFDHTDIHYGPTLGKGGEGIVQKCTVRYNELLVDAAVKTVLNNTDDGLEITFDEIEMLCLAHDPIMTTTIKVYGVAAVPDRENPTHGHLVIIMEAGIKNALQLYQDETIPFHVTLDLWHRLAVSLHCIHKKNIIHQDLKPENVLITGLFRDHYGILERLEAKVIDLGMARLVEGGKVVTEDVLGTTGYHSPEVLFDETYDFKADVFVLGITFCVMLLNQLTLRTAPLQAFLKRVHEAKERGLVGQSLFFSVIQPLIDKDICLPTVISEMICKMLERVDRRNISLLEVAATCQKESLNARQHPNNNHTKPRNSHDSGIDSCEFKPRRRTKKNDGNEDEDEMEENVDDANDGDDDNDDTLVQVPNPHNLRKNRKKKSLDLPGEQNQPNNKTRQQQNTHNHTSTDTTTSLLKHPKNAATHAAETHATRNNRQRGRLSMAASRQQPSPIKRATRTAKTAAKSTSETPARKTASTNNNDVTDDVTSNNASPVCKRLRSCAKRVRGMNSNNDGDDDEEEDEEDDDGEGEDGGGAHVKRRKRMRKTRAY